MALDCFCGQPIGTLVDIMQGNLMSGPLGMVLGISAHWENP